MQIKSGKLGTKLITPPIYADDRGFFTELFNAQNLKQMGIDFDVKQVNYSKSHYGVLRGLHFQRQKPQAKIVQVLVGKIYDVCVDINPKSPTFGQYEAFVLSSEKRTQLLVPKGLAHGFCVLSKTCCVQYLCDEFFMPNLNAGIKWDDPFLAIKWPLNQPKLSKQDQNWLFLQDLNTAILL